MTDYRHVPVMCAEILDLLAPSLAGPAPLMVDATLGLGGHASAALERFGDLHLIGIDRDPQAIAATRERLRAHAGRFETHQARYDQLAPVLAGRRPDAILFDLGLSSLQIDSAERGFAYATDAPLSMRMDADPDGLSAADVVNTYPAAELSRLFRVYGDEKHAARIARAIVAEREVAPFTGSARLAQTIAAAVPAAQTRSGHPAKRVLQALRIEVNQERASLEQALPAALKALKTHGRLAVLSYHSGEDRLVKQQFATASSDQAPPGLAVVPASHQARYRLVLRGAGQPTAAEAASNPRSQSARLRVIERIKE